MSKLKSIAWATDAALVPVLRNQSFSVNLVLDAYWTALPPVRTDGVGKVIVHLTPDASQAGRVSDELLAVVEAFQAVDAAAFDALPEADKRGRLLQWLHDGLLDVARGRGWDITPFDTAFAAAVSQGIRLGGPLGKVCSSADRNSKAQLVFEYDSQIRVYVAMSDKLEQKRILITTLPPTLAALEAAVGTLKWCSDDVLEIGHKNKKDRWVVKLKPAVEIDLETERARRNDPHGLYDLALAYSAGQLVPRDLTKARMLLQRSADAGYSRARAALRKLEENAESAD